MSETTAIPDMQARAAERKAPRGKTFAEHPLVQLTIVRFLETLREPEALFWIFAFPILLAGGLGIAFRNRPAEVLKIATVTPEITQSLQKEKLLAVQQLDLPAAEEALRTGKVALLAVAGANGAIVYRYDDTNPEGRTARMLADRAVQQAAGRVDPVSHQRRADARTRLSLYRFPHSRFARNESDGQRDLGHGFYGC